MVDPQVLVEQKQQQGAKMQHIDNYNQLVQSSCPSMLAEHLTGRETLQQGEGVQCKQHSVPILKELIQQWKLRYVNQQ